MGFVANFIRYLAVQNFENQLRFYKISESLQVGTFLRHSVVLAYKQCCFSYHFLLTATLTCIP